MGGSLNVSNSSSTPNSGGSGGTINIFNSVKGGKSSVKNSVSDAPAGGASPASKSERAQEPIKLNAANGNTATQKATGDAKAGKAGGACPSGGEICYCGTKSNINLTPPGADKAPTGDVATAKDKTATTGAMQGGQTSATNKATEGNHPHPAAGGNGTSTTNASTGTPQGGGLFGSTGQASDAKGATSTSTGNATGGSDPRALLSQSLQNLKSAFGQFESVLSQFFGGAANAAPAPGGLQANKATGGSSVPGMDMSGSRTSQATGSTPMGAGTHNHGGGSTSNSATGSKTATSNAAGGGNSMGGMPMDGMNGMPMGGMTGTGSATMGGMSGSNGANGLYGMSPPIPGSDNKKFEGYIKNAGTMEKFGSGAHNGIEHTAMQFPGNIIPGQGVATNVTKNGNTYTIHNNITAQDFVADLANQKVMRDNPKLQPGSKEFNNKLATQLTNFNNFGNIKNEPKLKETLAKYGLTEEDAQNKTRQHLYHTTGSPAPIEFPGGRIPDDFKIVGNSFHQYDKNNWALKDLGNGQYQFQALSNNNNKDNSHNNHLLAAVNFSAGSPEQAMEMAKKLPDRITAKTEDKDDLLNTAVSDMFGYPSHGVPRDLGSSAQLVAALQQQGGMGGHGGAGHSMAA